MISPSARSVYVFGSYLVLAGIGLFFFNNLIFGLLNIPSTTDVWVRLTGLLTFILGIFFVTMARQNVSEFFSVSLIGRMVFIIGVLSLIVFAEAPIQLLIFVIVDFIGFGWTMLALRKK